MLFTVSIYFPMSIKLSKNRVGYKHTTDIFTVPGSHLPKDVCLFTTGPKHLRLVAMISNHLKKWYLFLLSVDRTFTMKIFFIKHKRRAQRKNLNQKKIDAGQRVYEVMGKKYVLFLSNSFNVTACLPSFFSPNIILPCWKKSVTSYIFIFSFLFCAFKFPKCHYKIN